MQKRMSLRSFIIIFFFLLFILVVEISNFIGNELIRDRLSPKLDTLRNPLRQVGPAEQGCFRVLLRFYQNIHTFLWLVSHIVTSVSDVHFG